MNDSIHSPPFLRSRFGIGLLVLGAVAGLLLLTEHFAHALGVLPYLLLLACPIMHVFMHHGQNNGHTTQPSGAKREGSTDARN